MVGGKAADADAGTSRSRLSSLRSVASPGGLVSLLLALAVFAGVALPFVSSDVAAGELPIPAFGDDRPMAREVYDQLQGLLPGETALLALEYGPTAAGELDGLTDLALRHILARGGMPVIVSGNPIAIAHARNIIKGIAQSVAPHGIQIVENRDYVILRYLSGGIQGLRDLSRNFSSATRNSARGELTGLTLKSLDDFTLMALVAERAEDVRNWAEHIAPETSTPLLVITGFAAQPLAQPYVAHVAGIDGMLIGIRDVYTYGEMLQSAYAAYDTAPRPTLTPTLTIVPTLTAAPSDTPVATQTAAPEPSPTPKATVAPPPTDTPTPAPSALPSSVASLLPRASAEMTRILPTDRAPDADHTQAAATDSVVATVVAQAQVASAATPEPSETPQPALLAVVKGPQQARIRRDASTASPIVGLASEGESLTVLGENDDGSWLRVEMSNGWRGWIAEFLVEQTDEDSGSLDGSASAPAEESLLQLRVSLELGKNRPRFYQAQTLPKGVRPEFVLRRDSRFEEARLHAMTIGVTTAVAIVILGNAMSLMRALLHRRRDNLDE